MKHKLYKSLKAGLTSYADFTWEVGKWYKAKGGIVACKNGFHGSKNIIDAMGFVNMECLAEVEVKGKSDKSEKDKEAWENMRIVKAWHWEKQDSVALSIYAAELCIENFEKIYPDDKRPREAIEAAKKWLSDPTEENRSAARSAESAAWSAAWSAARSAAWSARSAASAESAESAESAARSAARSAESAAESAAWSAERSAESAESAAWSAAESAASAAILKKLHTWIVKRTKQLKEIK